MINGRDSLKLKKKARCDSITALLNEYKTYICNSINSHMKNSYAEFFYQLSLIDFDYQPNDMSKQGSDKFKETIYSLLNAPTNQKLLKSNDEMSNYIKERYFSFSLHMGLYANSNRIINVATKGFGKAYEDYDKEELGILFHNSILGGN